MLKTAEAVSIGHPDKTADYISSYILDTLIRQDPDVRYAVEVMIKNHTVVLGGEITGPRCPDNWDTAVKEALCDIGYDERYASIWQDKAINVRQVRVINLVSAQSPDIAQGITHNGWGDQGIFVGYACQGAGHINRELWLARQLNQALYDKARSSNNLGLDIKTQITLDESGHITTAIAAVPMLSPEPLDDFIANVLGEKPDNIIINGTGTYQRHGSIADCGITGRKLACDFYAAASPIGGGSPWTKDGTKADLALNLYARYLALQYLQDNDECFVYLSSCIGRSDLPSGMVKTIRKGITRCQKLSVDKTPREIIAQFRLNTPIYATLCRQGITSLF